VFLVGFWLAISCSTPSESSWQSLYANARREYRSGYTEKALHLADTGYQQTEKRDQVWNWRFRILKAQIGLRQGKPDQAINLLASAPPANSPPDVSVRRRTIQGQVFCQLGKETEAEEALVQADNLAKGESASLNAEIALTRGLCVMFRDP
jgi:predicted negative regulator of RcsB-dependent stress response